LVSTYFVGAAATTFFLTEVDVLARGATERAAAYVLPIGLAVTGIGLWRTRSADPTEVAEARRQRAERARERDEALEAAARRAESRTSTTGATGSGPVDDDAEDHWAPVRRTD